MAKIFVTLKLIKSAPHKVSTTMYSNLLQIVLWKQAAFTGIPLGILATYKDIYLSPNEILLIPFFILLTLAWYYGASRYILTRSWARNDLRARSWLIQILISSTMSVVSFPFFLKSMESENDFKDVMYRETGLYRRYTLFFVIASYMDLFIGSIEYPDYLDVFSGWFHHLLFIYVISYPLHYATCGSFLILTITEVPSFIIALGTIVPKLRSDYLFGSSFFVLRILYAAWCLHMHWRLAPYSYITLSTFASFLMNCFWFMKWVRGMVGKIAVKPKLV